MPKRVEKQQEESSTIKINNIATSLEHLAVDITKLVPDPMNAREHSEKNLNAIMSSLQKYGQVKPIVVRKSNNVVVAGNGTLASAKKLGWTKIAANYIDFNDRDAIGFGILDNKSAELANWNFEVLAQLEALQREQGEELVGFSELELKRLRQMELAKEKWEKMEEELEEKWIVLIECTGEEHQLELLNEFMERGLICKALIS